MDDAQSHLLDKIEVIRRNNNLWWMRLVRLAIESNPTEAKRLMGFIEANDRRVTETWKSLRETLPG